MQKMIYRFEELSSDLQHLAGGKGGSLAKLYQSGFPIPEGFVIAASAFADDQLLPEAWRQVRDQLDLLRGDDGEQALRSALRR